MPTRLVGLPAPDFEMKSTKNLETLDEKVKLSDYEGEWLVLFFYPKDFTFVCPTEITALSNRYEEFRDETVTSSVSALTRSSFIAPGSTLPGMKTVWVRSNTPSPPTRHTA